MSQSHLEYESTLHFLYTTLPMFQRVGKSAYKKNLNNIKSLCATLDNPHHKFPSIHIGGTNGKGSSAHMISSILQCAGYKTGLYTSPHLKRFTERIKVNGIEIPESFVVRFVREIKPQLKLIQPSFFELTVAMAFSYFASEAVDIGVIEVGLGGRLDSTNIIDPLVSLITHIGYDHEYLLGHTLPLIAKEKAGIIKSGKKTVITETQSKVRDVFLQQGKAVRAVIEFAQNRYRVIEHSSTPSTLFEAINKDSTSYRLTPGLFGSCQKKNIVGVLCVIDELRQQHFHISTTAVEQGVSDVVKITSFKGRWQQLGCFPSIYCDIAHNEDGIREVLKAIQQLHYKKLHIVFGMVKDKRHASILSLLPTHANYYFCQAKMPRSMPAYKLQEEAKLVGLESVVIADVNDAIRQAKARATPDDLIFIGGSTFVVAEINKL